MAQSTTAHTEGHAGEKAFPPFQPENYVSQLLWLAISFAALYLLMSKLALPRLGGILAARSQRIADDLAEAERKREASDAALAAYEKALADARDRAQVVANETRERLNAESEKMRHALESKLGAHLAEAEKKIAVTKSAAMSSVRAIAAESTAAIVERLTGRSPASAAVDAALADALKR